MNEDSIDKILESIDFETFPITTLQICESWEGDMELGGKSDPQIEGFIANLEDKTWTASELMGSLQSNPAFIAIAGAKGKREQIAILRNISDFLKGCITTEIELKYCRTAELQTPEIYEEIYLWVGRKIS